ncbi:hypothetical protein GXM_03339 [Nostoc sphaeroides CCNUC1]|uniref:Uncharacterized protein n=1 Tax=Nostoc sphaeroides CCNUC1 TaxID=2653204 RepID=A0A5P8VZM2_9NOSO|nr:hypothetical protein GXM_03339 [Nostoc sphaeroides CCNUC1]
MTFEVSLEVENSIYESELPEIKWVRYAFGVTHPTKML